MPLNSKRRGKLDEELDSALVTSNWLKENGVSEHAIDNLVKSGYLKSLVKGVYSRPNEVLTWENFIYTLQYILGTDLVIGGMTSLQLQGYGHYIPMNQKNTVVLYGTDRLPLWVNRISIETKFERYNQLMLWDNWIKEKLTILHSWRQGKPDLIISGKERAFIEMLKEVPERISFEHADEIMQGLTAASPENMQELLEHCISVKVKRLFFWLARRYNYSWLNKLDKQRINFGSGKRVLLPGGKLDKEFQITVPLLP